ncbi:hypothetical protein [Lapidilactobacillus bayanensis]|uniref:hypothetical protein n=1 Tax=Lapidilactobacillus bayanensis TaxID=2485998 RepID=UPI000F78EDE8|nr:hypothetical protein [Lapidilactobacillus bayanensis]
MKLTDKDVLKGFAELADGVDIHVRASFEGAGVDSNGASPVLTVSMLAMGLITELERLEDKEDKLLILSSVIEQLTNEHNNIKGEN